ncbi:hypothetical protein [Streptomyces bobili]|uniref:hypothetical protein n=1 Tax=Streptomyces bobili TaxID=67280 RepID=UPI003F4D7E69
MLTDDRGRLLWVSAARPGRTSESTACRRDQLTAKLRAAGLGAIADLGFVGLDDSGPDADPAVITGYKAARNRLGFCPGARSDQGGSSGSIRAHKSSSRIHGRVVTRCERSNHHIGHARTGHPDSQAQCWAGRAGRSDLARTSCTARTKMKVTATRRVTFHVVLATDPCEEASKLRRMEVSAMAISGISTRKASPRRPTFRPKFPANPRRRPRATAAAPQNRVFDRNPAQ